MINYDKAEYSLEKVLFIIQIRKYHSRYLFDAFYNFFYIRNLINDFKDQFYVSRLIMFHCLIDK